MSSLSGAGEASDVRGSGGVPGGDGQPPMGDLAQATTLIDRGFQLAYKLAYRMMRVYWGVRRPATHGALVTLWNDGQVLLIQNSYVNYRSLPGGYVGRYETGAEAAVRELREEIGIVARPDELERVYDEVKDWEGKRDHVEVFRLELERRPQIVIDRREVIAAGWYSPARALELDLFPPIRLILEAHLRQQALSQT
ncbi:MAG TPA: NUDIX domain-containing protein [Polyangiaceae bacterium]|nr:NUDIX domain-containing protein [Polyangiaceae bacterium]